MILYKWITYVWPRCHYYINSKFHYRTYLIFKNKTINEVKINIGNTAFFKYIPVQIFNVLMILYNKYLCSLSLQLYEDPAKPIIT